MKRKKMAMSAAIQKSSRRPMLTRPDVLAYFVEPVQDHGQLKIALVFRLLRLR